MGGCTGSTVAPEAQPTVEPAVAFQPTAAPTRTPAFVPPPMSGTENVPQDVTVQEWVSKIAQRFEFKTYSFNEYTFTTETSWDQVSGYYDAQMAAAGWEKVAAQGQMAFYRNQKEQKYIILVFSSAATSSAKAYATLIYSYNVSEEQGAVVAGSFYTDYQPRQDGFGFKNYRDEQPRGDMTIEELRTVFGDAVCIRIENGKCVPIPNASLWMAQMNTLSRIGHCTGMTVLSGLLKSDNIAAKKLLNSDTAFNAVQDIPLLRRISADWAVQITNEVTGSTVQGTPKRVVYELLKTKLIVDVGIFSSEGGHSMLGYGVEDKGSGIFWINVYDGNAPGEARYIEVDANANTWAYSFNGLDPKMDSKAWRGDAESNTLLFIPVDTYSKNLTCPFCFNQGSAQNSGGPLASGVPQRKGAAGSTLVSLTGSGNASLLATTASGQRVGIADGQMVNEVPGVRIVRMRGGAQHSFVIILPPEVDFRLEFTGATGSSLLIMSPTFSTAANNIQDNNFQVNFSPTSNSVSYSSNGTNSPVFVSVTQFSDALSTAVMVGGMPMQPGQVFSFSQPAAGAPFVVGITGEDGSAEPSSPILAVVTVTPSGNGLYASSGWLNLESGSALSLNIPAWQNGAPLPVTLSSADGSPPQIFSIPDQPIASVLPALQIPPNIIFGLEVFIPYLDSFETQAFLEQLGNMVFGGAQLGGILLHFDEVFGLTPEQLRRLAISWGLTGDELMAFANALFLPPEQMAVIAAPLPQPYSPGALAALALQKKTDVPPQEDDPAPEEPAPAPRPTPAGPTITIIGKLNIGCVAPIMMPLSGATVSIINSLAGTTDAFGDFSITVPYTGSTYKADYFNNPFPTTFYEWVSPAIGPGNPGDELEMGSYSMEDIGINTLVVGAYPYTLDWSAQMAASCYPAALTTIVVSDGTNSGTVSGVTSVNIDKPAALVTPFNVPPGSYNWHLVLVDVDGSLFYTRERMIFFP